MPVRIIVDPDLCIGSTECNRLAPEAFLLDEELGVSVPLPGAELADLDRLHDAEAGCPTGAITITAANESTGAEVPA
jgi:ferredoxin